MRGLLGFAPYTIEQTRTGKWVPVIEEILSTAHARGRNLRVGRRLMEHAINEAVRDGRVTEIHLIVRSTEQQTHAHDLYISCGISRQLTKDSRNRIKMDGRLVRDAQYWTGLIGRVAEQGSRLGQHKAVEVREYTSLGRAQAGERNCMREAFDAVHGHERGDKVPWAEHEQGSKHVAVWERVTMKEQGTEEGSNDKCGECEGGRRETSPRISKPDTPPTDSDDEGDKGDAVVMGAGKETGGDTVEQTSTSSPERAGTKGREAEKSRRRGERTRRR